MEALNLLLNRSSFGKLQAPAPNEEELNVIYKAALRAPDHKGLRPWRFLVYRTEAALNKLGNMFLEATIAEEGEVDEAKRQKILNMPHRAPVLIIAIAQYQDSPKVPHIEQAISCGCAVHGMLYALQAQGFAGYWRTGGLAFNNHLKAALDLKVTDEIIGFLYMGTPMVSVVKPDSVETADYFFEQ
ncbi:MAG: nitroreductase family protein [Gammaproteobacteria bacterium]|nr:nitroreductase family protein [Gammaproteobacteria bacterium]